MTCAPKSSGCSGPGCRSSPTGSTLLPRRPSAGLARLGRYGGSSPRVTTAGQAPPRTCHRRTSPSPACSALTRFLTRLSPWWTSRLCCVSGTQAMRRGTGCSGWYVSTVPSSRPTHRCAPRGTAATTWTWHGRSPHISRQRRARPAGPCRGSRQGRGQSAAGVRRGDGRRRCRAGGGTRSCLPAVAGVHGQVRPRELLAIRCRGPASGRGPWLAAPAARDPRCRVAGCRAGRCHGRRGAVGRPHRGRHSSRRGPRAVPGPRPAGRPRRGTRRGPRTGQRTCPIPAVSSCRFSTASARPSPRCGTARSPTARPAATSWRRPFPRVSGGHAAGRPGWAAWRDGSPVTSTRRASGCGQGLSCSCPSAASFLSRCTLRRSPGLPRRRATTGGRPGSTGRRTGSGNDLPHGKRCECRGSAWRCSMPSARVRPARPSTGLAPRGTRRSTPPA